MKARVDNTNLRKARWVSLLSVAALFYGPAALAGNPYSISFKLSSGTVKPHEPYGIKVRVLGSAITYGGHYDEMVTVRVYVDGQAIDPFGNWDEMVASNVNDGQEHHFIINEVYEKNTEITVTGRSWIMPDYDTSLPDGGLDASDPSEWTLRRQRNSYAQEEFVITLRDGDVVPDIAAFMDQPSIEEYVRPFIDQRDNTVVLGDNQVIFLFELGKSDSNSPTIDFQDLVVLVTLGATPVEAALIDVPALLAD